MQILICFKRIICVLKSSIFTLITKNISITEFIKLFKLHVYYRKCLVTEKQSDVVRFVLVYIARTDGQNVQRSARDDTGRCCGNVRLPSAQSTQQQQQQYRSLYRSNIHPSPASGVAIWRICISLVALSSAWRLRHRPRTQGGDHTWWEDKQRRRGASLGRLW